MNMRNYVKALRRRVKVKGKRSWTEEAMRKRWEGKKEKGKARYSKTDSACKWIERKTEKEDGSCSSIKRIERKNDINDEAFEE